MLNFKATKIRLRFTESKVDEQPIFIPKTLDAMNLPIKHGLQDINLGPQSSEPSCSFCESNNFDCPGHFGSIDLHTMVLNPILFKYLLMILSASCSKCQKFSISNYDREMFANLDKEAFFQALKENISEKCIHCKFKKKIKKLNMKIIINDQYIQPSKIYQQIEQLYENDKIIFEKTNIDYRSFFIHKILIIPNRFRPLNVFDNQVFESSHNIHLAKIIKLNNLLKQEIENTLIEEENKTSAKKPGHKLKKILDEQDDAQKTEEKIQTETTHLMDEKLYFEIEKSFMAHNNGVNQNTDRNLNTLLDTLKKETVEKLNNVISALQSSIQHYYDSSEFPAKDKPPGIKQVLEKKEGLFRQNMMGKRVNFTARTVISADPFIAVDEIGIPVEIAKKLTFPEKVTPFNRKRLEKAVINGSKYPGAEFVIEKGQKRLLQFAKNRKIIARTLLKNNAIVHRHMATNDYVLVNRQPTLHKPSLMSHRVKILDDKTIRLHYVNCGSYNADFDGDEMNIHLCQSYVAMAEHSLSATHENFVLNGNVLRGLVQDYIAAIFQLTLKDTFFTRQEMQNLLISSGQSGFEIKNPAILRPKEFYTGKQLIQFILSAFGNVDYERKNKIPPAYWKISNNTVPIFDESKDSLKETRTFDDCESFVKIQSGIFIHGILDKSQVGATANSLIHHCGRTFSYKKANDLLSALCLTISKYLIGWGVSLGLSDLLLTKEANLKRSQILEKGVLHGDQLTKEVIALTSQTAQLDGKVQEVYLDANERANLNNIIKKKMHETTSAVSDLLIRSVIVPFPHNNMANIILSGAKGSIVNFSQISGLLGQQSLEGGRVPTLPNGRGLCTFTDLGVISNGFVINRFSTGLLPSSFFFHCQGGREGLIDTAVKTSIAGYLQRSLVAALENVKVDYDGSVKDTGLLQFVYGDDCKNPNYSSDINPDRVRMHPGESVGVLAAQAIGEPSTQMTLNTFHLAGCATNVTLGMPRLKEILMTGGKTKTRYLKGELLSEITNGSKNKNKTDNDSIVNFLQGFTKLPLSDVLFYHRASQSDGVEVVFVFNRDIPENIRNHFKTVFLKTLNKCSSSKDIIYEVRFDMTDQKAQTFSKDSESEDEKLPELPDYETLEDLEKDFAPEKTRESLTYSSISSIYSEDALRVQIATNQFESKNVIKIVLNKAVSVDQIIEKMLDTFFIVDSGIEDVSFMNDLVHIGGIDYHHMFVPIIARDQLPFSTFSDVKPEYAPLIPQMAELSEIFDFNTICSSDIQDTLEVLGVEAARTTIIREIKDLFAAFGITIDIRHLMLIADKLLYTGQYSAFNRHKMDGGFLRKMAFENTYGFLQKSFLFQDEDDLKDPSAQLVMGLPVRNGTGYFDIVDEETGKVLN
ncbi:DNA-directed RNA polymerase I largest subunit [Pseudoloma neurophilia]|uniref:DNA-directed RNA polymerase subunit n=1 Tax=Pseudoloma neurophilia TaxID=146866 RepID=A0A0R0M6Y9_9MICR|nr:DNA-directed RNA polymerase I largest subunit [Pseudoloma neurophilia]